MQKKNWKIFCCNEKKIKIKHLPARQVQMKEQNG